MEIAGIAHGLTQGLIELGVAAELLLSVKHPFQYDQQKQPWWLRTWQWLGSVRAKTLRTQFLQKLFLVCAHNLWGWLVLVLVLSRFDAFFFLFGQTITNSRFELWLLRRLGKRIIFIYAGSDVRPPYIDGGKFPGRSEDPLPNPAVLASSARRCKRRIKLHELYADYLVNSPATAQFFERPYINWFAIGIPRVFAIPARKEEKDSCRLRILHSPSNPAVKGSFLIAEIVERLKTKGYPVDLIMIESMPNQRVLEELACCDFVIDQMYSDTPLAGFATEAAFFGKPAVVGGYFSSQIAQYLSMEDMPPSLFVEPSALEAAVERLVVDVDFRHELGQRAQRFVNLRWSARAVATRYLQLLNDDVPQAWWCDPLDVHYVEGCGLSRERAKRLVDSLVSHGGIGALQLSDKPALEQAVFALASGDHCDA